MTDIKSFDLNELKDFISSMALPSFRASQLWLWLQQKGVDDFDLMTNLPEGLRTELKNRCVIKSCQIEKKSVSRLDGTVKYLFRLYDGEFIESVLMSHRYGYSLCLSTQVGCRMNCAFCATGKGGFVRDLSASEMLSQIHAAQNDEGKRISHLVLMGMGEPLDNYDNVLKFLHLVNDAQGLNIGMRNISLSTCGIVPGIKRLQNENLQLTLSVSLHAPNDRIRSRLMPINRKYNVDTLLSACKDYSDKTSRRISYEYTMFGGVNDSPECARELSKKLAGTLSHINLIPANDVEGSAFHSSNRENIAEFVKILENAGRTVTVRRSLGGDIDASCGQLRSKHKKQQALKGGAELKIFSKSDVGLVRSENQDSFRIAELSDGSVFCVVCDGMGGPAGGKTASEKAAEQIYKTVTSCYRHEMRSTGVVNLLRSASVNANAIVYDIACSDASLRGMGTTAVAALLIGDELYVSNVGDSRCYIASGEGIRQITKDHSLVQELVDAGKLSPEKAENHPNKNIITRAIGVDSDVDIDIIIEDVSEGDVIILCTDGLSNFADNKEIYDILMNKDDPDPAETLVEKALENGGGDNVTAAVVML